MKEIIFKIIVLLLLLIMTLNVTFSAESSSSVKIFSIIFENTSDGGEVTIKANGVIKYSSILLTDPPRIAIDIPNVILKLEKNPDINNKIVKSVKASQASPDNVRVVVELKKSVSIKIGSRIKLDQVKLKLNYSNEDMSGSEPTPVPETAGQEENSQKLSASNTLTQQIRDVKFEEKNDSRKIFITTTGPVTYEWHRLKSPDNRIYIDFTDVILNEKKLTVPVTDNLVSDIRAAQNQKSPNIVRLVFRLNKSVNVNFYQSQKVANQLTIEMGKDEINESSMATIGKGSIGYLNTGKTIVIDPGHGGSDYGAINPETGLAEKDVTLDIALRLQEFLTQDGWNVILTRSTDRDVTTPDSTNSEELLARANIANQGHAVIFMSIHCDSSTKDNVKGTSAFYYKDTDKSLAIAIHKSLISKLGLSDRGVKSANFCVLKHAKMSATLIEVAFISNADDAKMLADTDAHEKIAGAIFEGICEYTKGPSVIGGK